MNDNVPHERPLSHLQYKFAEINSNLRLLCKLYDEGKIQVASIIATQVYILVGHTSSHKGVLNQLSINNEIKFIAHFSMQEQAHNPNTISHWNSDLVVITPLRPNGVTPILTRVIGKTCELSLTDWLTKDAHVSQTPENASRMVSRKDILILLRNQEGGAHLDRQISKNKEAMLRFPFTIDDDGTMTFASQFPVYLTQIYACARQIAHEYLISIEAHFGTSEQAGSYTELMNSKQREFEARMRGE